MKKLSKQSRLFLLAIFALVTGGLLGFFAYKMDASFAQHSSFKFYQRLEGKFLVVTDISASSSNYILTEEFFYEENPFQRSLNREKKDYHKVIVYQPSHGGKVYKTFDLLKISQAYHPTFIPNYVKLKEGEIVRDLFRKQTTGEIYFSFPVVNSHLGDTWHYSDTLSDMIYVNIETGKAVYTSAGLNPLKNDYSPDSTSVDAAVEGFSERLSRLDVNFFAETKKGAYIIAETYSKSLKGSNLANNYPELIAEAQTKDKERYGADPEVYIYLSGKDAYAKLAKLLAQEGQEDIFDGLTLKAANSKDGQSHKLSSYVDFLKYYKEN